MKIDIFLEFMCNNVVEIDECYSLNYEYIKYSFLNSFFIFIEFII